MGTGVGLASHQGSGESYNAPIASWFVQKLIRRGVNKCLIDLLVVVYSLSRRQEVKKGQNLIIPVNKSV